MAFNINQYIYEQRRIGKDDKQIATSLGMSLKHFQNYISGEKKEAAEEKQPSVAEKRAKKVEEKKQEHEKQKEQFKGWRDEGLSNAQIAEKADVTEATVVNVIETPTKMDEVE